MLIEGMLIEGFDCTYLYRMQYFSYVNRDSDNISVCVKYLSVD